MLKFISDTTMQDGEVAAMYTDGKDGIVMLNEKVTDSQLRCQAVNNLLRRVRDSLTL